MCGLWKKCNLLKKEVMTESFMHAEKCIAKITVSDGVLVGKVSPVQKFFGFWLHIFDLL